MSFARLLWISCVGGAVGSLFYSTTSHAEAERTSVHFVIVSSVLSQSDVQQALGESAYYQFQFKTLGQFSPDSWYRSTSASQGELRVWLVAEESGPATLYFADPGSDRFLVRHLSLSPSFDEMDKEILAQAIKWSLEALSLETVDALTREQASRLVADEARIQPAETRPNQRHFAEQTEADSSGVRPVRATVFDLALGYQAAHDSPQIPIVHGPYVRAGVDLRSSAVQLGVGVFGWLTLPARYEHDELAVRVADYFLRCELRALFFMLGQRLALGPYLGFGFEFSRVEALTSTDSLWTSSGASTTTMPILALGLAGQNRLNKQVRLDWATGIDVGLRSVHYDVQAQDSVEVFIAPSAVRPNVRVGLSFF